MSTLKNNCPNCKKQMREEFERDWVFCACGVRCPRSLVFAADDLKVGNLRLKRRTAIINQLHESYDFMRRRSESWKRLARQFRGAANATKEFAAAADSRSRAEAICGPDDPRTAIGRALDDAGLKVGLVRHGAAICDERPLEADAHFRDRILAIFGYIPREETPDDIPVVFTGPHTEIVKEFSRHNEGLQESAVAKAPAARPKLTIYGGEDWS